MGKDILEHSGKAEPDDVHVAGLRKWTGFRRIAALASGRATGRIGRQISLVVIGDGVTFAVATLSTMILARIMPVDWMGTYRQVLYLTQFAVTVADLGLGASIYRFWNLLEGEDRAIFVRMAIVASIMLAVPAMLLLMLSAPLLADLYRNEELTLALVIAAPLPLATLPLALIRPALLTQGSSLRATLIETALALLAIFSMVLPITLGMSLNAALGVWIAVSLGRLVLVPIIFRRYISRGSIWWSNSLLRSVWGYLWPMQLSRVPSYLTIYLDKVIMSVRLLPRDFAVYSLGAREIPFVGIIAYSVSNVLLPHLVEDTQSGNIGQICRRWKTSCARTAQITYFFAGFSVWNAPEVMRFLFSSTYESASVPFRIFAVLTYLRVVEFGSIAKAFGKTRFLLYSTTLDAVLLCVFGVLLTGPFGIVGMALSVVTAEIVANVYLLVANRQMLGRSLGEFFPWKGLLALLVISLLSNAAGRQLSDAMMTFAPDDGMPVLGVKLIVLGLFSGALYLAFLKIKQVVVSGWGAQAS